MHFRLRVSVLALLWMATLPGAFGQRLSPLAPAPDWSRLEAFQETITREEFAMLLDHVYAPGGTAKGLIEVAEDAAVIKTSLVPPAEFRLRFAKAAASAKPVPRWWRPAASFIPAPPDRPLEGVKIAIDPGHIGGEWAQMEERWFRIGDSKPVAEGEMTLYVAQWLAPQLKAMGAEVLLVRDTLAPVTPQRPETLHDAARAELALEGVNDPRVTYDPLQLDDPHRGQTVQWHSERLFYRVSEIRQRAEIVNQQFQPDLVLCLHFNAEAWGGDPKNPEFVPRNHLHVLVNGCYSAGELRFDDQRIDLLLKLLNRSFAEELAASETIGSSVAIAANLPPYAYTTGNAKRVGDSPFVWARNLLANRLYEAPVVFLEPYVMNNEEVWARVQAGDYEGERMVHGAMRKSLVREYADGVAAGVRDYFSKTRQPQLVPK